MPSTVSVILPCTKRSGTGRNCALSESRGVESRLKYFHGSPRTSYGRPSAPTKVGSSPALDVVGRTSTPTLSSFLGEKKTLLPTAAANMYLASALTPAAVAMLAASAVVSA